MNSNQLREMDFEEVNTYIDELEQPLISELNALEEQPITTRQRRARRIEIRDERAGLWKIRARWRRLHRDPEAGPDQTIGDRRA